MMAGKGSVPPTRRLWGEHLKSAAAYAFLASIFMAGFGVAAAIWSSSLSPMQAELARVREEREHNAAELDKVKREYALYRVHAAVAPTPAPSARSSPAPSASPPTTESVVVSQGSSQEVLNGALLISVAAIDLDFRSGTYVATGTVGAPGYPSASFEKKTVGYSLELTASERFDVRLLAINTFTARFQVTRLKK